MNSENSGRLAAFVSLSLSFTCLLLYSAVLIPGYASTYQSAADLATVGSVLFFLALAFFAYHMPRLVGAPVFGAVLFSFVVSAPLVLIGAAWTKSSMLLVVGAIVFYIGQECAFFVALVAAMKAYGRRFVGCALAAMACAYALTQAVQEIGATEIVAGPVLVAIVAFALPVVVAVAGWGAARRLLDDASRSEPLIDTLVATPQAVPRLPGPLFACLFVLQVVFGYSVHGFESAHFSMFPLLGLCALCLWWVILRPSFSLDRFFRVTLMILCGALTFRMLGSSVLAGALGALLAFSNCIIVLALALIVIESTRRYEVSALGLFSWGMALSETGIVLGAIIYQFAARYHAEELSAGILMLSLVAFILFALPGFSIDGIIAALRRPPEVGKLMGLDVADGQEVNIDSAWMNIGSIARAYSLTPREEEIFSLLARGRNGVHIQKKLCISRNTYKTHSRHIYEKLGVHSQQEVIDLAETYRSENHSARAGQ